MPQELKLHLASHVSTLLVERNGDWRRRALGKATLRMLVRGASALRLRIFNHNTDWDDVSRTLQSIDRLCREEFAR